MDLSIIIPTYNRQNLISYTLNSLVYEYHTGISYEVLVIDDGSTDNTLDFIARTYPHIIALKNNGKGAAAARNTGLRVAKGTFIVYLDSDDLVGKGFFEKKIKYLNEHSIADACYGDYDFFEGDKEFKESLIFFKNKYPVYDNLDCLKLHLIFFLSGKFIPPLAIVWRKTKLLALKGHDEALIINQDVDLFFRAIFSGFYIMGIKDGTKVYIRNHSVDMRVGDPRNDRLKWIQLLELRKKIFKELKLKGYIGTEYLKPLSYYIFSRWKMLRHKEKEIAEDYLLFVKEVYWPVKLRGNVFLKLLSLIFGPVNTIKFKYLLLKRD